MNRKSGTLRGRRRAKDRAGSLALLRTVHDLRRSVAAGRPMSLPNCLRLCRRRLAAGDSAVLERLEAIYRKHQPFQCGPHVIQTRSER